MKQCQMKFMRRMRYKPILSELIDDCYGSPENLAECLELVVEMLFYVEENTFERQDLQNAVSALRGIIRVLRE